MPPRRYRPVRAERSGDRSLRGAGTIALMLGVGLFLVLFMRRRKNQAEA